MVVHITPQPGESTTEIRFVHKRGQCQPAVRARLEKKGIEPAWLEMQDFLVNLCANGGFFPEQFKEHYLGMLQRGDAPVQSDEDDLLF